MSLIVEVAQYLMNAQSCMTGGVGDTCPATASTAVAAAWATQGYWVQADILEYLRGETHINGMAPYSESIRDLANIPILVYLLGGIAGLMGIALGAPPKNYMWFFIGPAIFSWLIDTTQPVKGVGWMLAHQSQRQEEVWRLSEVGLRNSNIVQRKGVNIYRSQEPDSTVEVATMFLWLDEVISQIVQSLSWWTGVYSQATGSTTTNTNLAGGVGGDGKWFLLSNLKWAMVEDITAARLHNAELRDMFAQFMASECGDEVAKAIDQTSFIHASKSRGASLRSWEDYTVFLHMPNHDYSNPAPNNAAVARMLSHVVIPVPDSLRFLLEGDSQGAKPGTLAQFAKFFDPNEPSCRFDEKRDHVNCATLLWIIVHAFRWEAAHVYQSMMDRIPFSLRYGGSAEFPLEFTLFYGWDIKKGRSNTNWLDSGEVLTAGEYRQFLLNLILIHLFRNEMEMVRKPLNIRYSASTEHQDYVEAFQARTGAKAKYGEIYSYAMMVPYIQGILLYFLAIAYPFACMMIVFPGWHKIFITWCSFWIWAKLWDVGFAFVLMIERSLWAMLGSNSDFAGLATFIVKMKDWGSTNINEQCSQNGCTFVNIVNDSGASALCGMQNFEDTLRTFDRALMLSSNLDLDLVNAYYLYFIAALYLAVPAVIGQIVLGAKAGVGGMVGQMFGGTATEGGKAAGEAYKGNFATLGHGQVAATRQAAEAAGARKSGLMAEALNWSNAATSAQARSAGLGTMSDNLGLMAGARARTDAVNQSAIGVVQAGHGAYQATRKEGATQRALEGRLNDPGGFSGARYMDELADGAAGTGGTGGGPSGSGSGSGSSARQIGGSGTPGGSRQMTPAYQAWLAQRDAAHGSQRAAQRAAGRADIANAVAGAGAAAARHYSGFTAAVDQTMMDAARADNQIAGLTASLGNMGMGAHGQRVRSNAEFQAGMAGYRAQRDLASQLTGIGSAIGVFPGSFSPGAKPTNMEGFAMSGMLNTYSASGQKLQDTQGAGNFFSPHAQGGFFGQSSGMLGQIREAGGSNGVLGQFHATSVGEAGMRAIPDAARGTKIGGFGGWSGQQAFNNTVGGASPRPAQESIFGFGGGFGTSTVSNQGGRLDSPIRRAMPGN